MRLRCTPRGGCGHLHRPCLGAASNAPLAPDLSPSACLSRRGIDVDPGCTKLLDQPAEVPGVASPAADVSAVQRLAYLDRARGRNRRPVTVKRKAGLLPIELEVIEQPLGLAARRRDQALVLDLVQPRTQQAVPMPHQPIEMDVV